MKLCPMIVQALWECKSPLLQLPYVQEEHLKHFVIRKVCYTYQSLNILLPHKIRSVNKLNFFFQRYIRNVQQFAQLRYEDKRSILKFLKDEQFEDVMKVISRMPQIDFEVRCEGKSYLYRLL